MKTRPEHRGRNACLTGQADPKDSILRRSVFKCLIPVKALALPDANVFPREYRTKIIRPQMIQFTF